MQRTWGPGKIVIVLWGVGFQISEATVGRVLRYPKKNKSLPPQARQQPHRRSTPRPRATRQQKGSRPHQPGERVQANTLFLRDPPGRWIYQLTVCDPASKLIAAERHHPFGAQHTGAFERILETFPVEIRGPDRQRHRVP